MDPVAHAAAHLRAGGLVVMPTETVYGLAAVARDAAAVRRVFEAKGRPATNPLIVHGVGQRLDDDGFHREFVVLFSHTSG